MLFTIFWNGLLFIAGKSAAFMKRKLSLWRACIFNFIGLSLTLLRLDKSIPFIGNTAIHFSLTEVQYFRVEDFLTNLFNPLNFSLWKVDLIQKSRKKLIFRNKLSIYFSAHWLLLLFHSSPSIKICQVFCTSAAAPGRKNKVFTKKSGYLKKMAVCSPERINWYI